MDWDCVRDEADGFDELAAEVEKRAERVLRHAEQASTEAEQAAADDPARHLRTWEARLHEQSAAVLKRTAGLYRTRAQELRARSRPPRIAGGANGSRTTYAADLRRIAAEREQIAIRREELATEREQIVWNLKWAIHQRARLGSEPAN